MNKFVSRAGEKLQFAIQQFGFSVKDLIVADFGSSTGGFVDCLLQNGARKIYSIDTSYGELAWILRNNPKYSNLFNEYKKGSYKLKDDPRITTVGHFLRKHSLDEVPQLFNILKGDMSLVGPRAYYPDELVDQQKKYPQTRKLVKEVLSVKPGITGAWQVSGRSEVNFDKRIALDAEYVRRKSIMYDIKILLRTPWAMISGKGAV